MFLEAFSARASSPTTRSPSTNYNVQKVLQTYWTGAKWSFRPDLDLAFGYYFQSQNNFLQNAACTGFGTTISSNKCAGGQQGISFLIDWRPWKRVDLYAGVMRNSVFGGLANGFNNYGQLGPVSRHPRPLLTSKPRGRRQFVDCRRSVPSPARRVTELC